MLVNKVTLAANRAAFDHKEIIRDMDKDGNITCVRLADSPNTAQVFRINENGDKIPFKIDEPVVNQEYEKDPYTPAQTEMYKRTLYSRVGCQVVNKLKNSKLITRAQFESILSHVKDVDVKKIMNMKAIKFIFPEEPRFRKFKRVDFNVEQFCFNKISLKDLGISKEDVINLFRQERLINF